MTQNQTSQRKEITTIASRKEFTSIDNVENPLSATRNRKRSASISFGKEVIITSIAIKEGIKTNSTIRTRASSASNITTFVNNTTDWLERLYKVTDAVLVICGIVIAISLIISLLIAILGILRIQRGLEYFTMTLEYD